MCRESIVSRQRFKVAITHSDDFNLIYFQWTEQVDKKATRSKVISHFENQQAIICRLKVDQEPFLHTCIGIHTRAHLWFEFVSADAFIEGCTLADSRFFQTFLYQGGVKSTVSWIFEDLKFKISEGYDQNWCFPDSAQLAVSV